MLTLTLTLNLALALTLTLSEHNTLLRHPVNYNLAILFTVFTFSNVYSFYGHLLTV